MQSHDSVTSQRWQHSKNPCAGNRVWECCLRMLTQMPTKMKQFSSHKKAASEQVQLWPRSTHLPGETVTSHRRLLIRRGRLGGPLTNGLGYDWGRASAASSGEHRPNEFPLTKVLHNCEREKLPSCLADSWIPNNTLETWRKQPTHAFW